MKNGCVKTGSASGPDERPHRAGGYALSLGLLALLLVLLPVIGDLFSVPLAVLAIGCGIVGVGQYDAGRSPRMLPSVLGAVLGAVSLLLTAVSLLALSPPG